MKVYEILKAKGDHVETARPDESMSMALHKLTTMRIGALVVSRDGARVDGVLSERDVVRGLTKHGPRLIDLTVERVMSKSVPTCSPDDPVIRVMAEMTHSRHRHVPVVGDGRLQGIVSIGDLVKSRLDELELEAAVLRDLWIAKQ